MAIKTFGTAVTVNTIAVGGLMSAEFSGAEVNNIDTTTWDATDNTRTYVGGLIEPGSLELSGNFLPSDAGQVEMEAETGNIATILVTYVDGTTVGFSAIIGANNISSELDGKLEFSRSLKISGVRTVTPD
jgi:predicted secreted protein